MTEKRGELIGRCPFCGKEYGYTVDGDGRPDGVTHAMPMCSKFQQLDPMEFLTAARNEIQVKRNIS